MDMARQMRVTLLIHLDHGVEEFTDTCAGTAHGRDYRHSEKVAQLTYVQLVSLGIQFIIHVQSHHDSEIHVYKLCGEIEIPLQIRGIYDIHHNIRHIFKEILPYIKFFRTVCRQGICAGKVHQDETVSAMLECALLGIHSHSAVVAHMLMSA